MEKFVNFQLFKSRARSIQAECINNDGSFTCKCNTGFYGDGRDEMVCDTGSVLGTPQFGETPSCCTDINECNADTAVCGILASCFGC